MNGTTLKVGEVKGEGQLDLRGAVSELGNVVLLLLPGTRHHFGVKGK